MDGNKIFKNLTNENLKEIYESDDTFEKIAKIFKPNNNQYLKNQKLGFEVILNFLIAEINDFLLKNPSSDETKTYDFERFKYMFDNLLKLKNDIEFILNILENSIYKNNIKIIIYIFTIADKNEILKQTKKVSKINENCFINKGVYKLPSSNKIYDFFPSETKNCYFNRESESHYYSEEVDELHINIIVKKLIELGNINIIEFLINNNVNFDYIDQYGRNLLSYSKTKKTAEFLISKIDSLKNLNFEDRFGRNIIMIIIDESFNNKSQKITKEQSIELIKYFMEKTLENKDNLDIIFKKKDNSGRNILMYLANRLFLPELIEYFFEFINSNKININLYDTDNLQNDNVIERIIRYRMLPTHSRWDTAVTDRYRNINFKIVLKIILHGKFKLTNVKKDLLKELKALISEQNHELINSILDNELLEDMILYNEKSKNPIEPELMKSIEFTDGKRKSSKRRTSKRKSSKRRTSKRKSRTIKLKSAFIAQKYFLTIRLRKMM